MTHEFFPRRGGIATWTEEMARATHQMGLDVEVWAQSLDKDMVEGPFPFPVIRMPIRGTQDFSCCLSTSKKIVLRRRDLRNAGVYLPEPGPISSMMFLQFFRAFRPGRLYLTFHGSEILKFGSNPAKRLLLRRLIGIANRVSTVSQFTHRLLHRHFPSSSTKAVLTPCALPSRLWDQGLIKRSSDNYLRILTVGRLHPRKGQDHLFKALGQLDSGLKSRIKFYLAGPGRGDEYEAKLRRLGAVSGLAEVRFFGDTTDEQLADLYRKSDIFAMTSTRVGRSVEGFGLVYLEAASFGLPVIGHATGGVKDAVQHGETGLLVSRKRPHELVEAFELLLRNRDFREKLGRNGAIWARNHRWEASAKLLFQEHHLKIGEDT